MKGLLLTGPTGVGKSTLQATLRTEHGFWVPRTCTTRSVEADERDVTRFDDDVFLSAVRGGDIVLPAFFGGHWYGWLREDLDALSSRAQPAVLNVRPYAALMLCALAHNLVAVWLALEEGELQKRRAGRRAARDTDLTTRMRREAEDDNDLVYKPCFANIVTADESAIARLLELSQ